jgi:hypothetical protein
MVSQLLGVNARTGPQISRDRETTVTAGDIAPVNLISSQNPDDEIDHPRAKVARLARGYDEELALFAQSGRFYSCRGGRVTYEARVEEREHDESVRSPFRRHLPQ